MCGGAWPFSVDVVLCLGHPVNDRLLSLLTSVKYDSSSISLSASWQVNRFFISVNYVIYAVKVLNFFELFAYAVTVSKFPNCLVLQVHFLHELILHKDSVEG